MFSKNDFLLIDILVETNKVVGFNRFPEKYFLSDKPNKITVDLDDGKISILNSRYFSHNAFILFILRRYSHLSQWLCNHRRQF